MEKNELLNEIDNKILDAKLTISEKRLQFVIGIGIALVAIFGVLVPIWLTTQSTDKIDKTISKIEERFAIIEGTKLKKPKISCFYKDNDLKNSKIIIGKEQQDNFPLIEIRNEGNASANRIRAFLYIEDKNGIMKEYISYDSFGRKGFSGNWFVYGKSEEEGYDGILQYNFDSAVPFLSVLDPKESFFININSGLFDRMKVDKLDVLLKLYYGQPEYERISFLVVLNKSK